MNWEDLKFYKPIKKEELINAKKSISSTICINLAPFGFKKIGTKLIRKSNDLIHIIHIDSRGTWQGSSNHIKTEIAIASIYDTEILVENKEPISSSYIQDLEPNLKNYYQITEEFNLFSEYLSRKIIEIILPYFDNYLSSKDIISKGIKIGETKNLREFCSLSVSEKLDDKTITFLKSSKNSVLKKLKITE